MGGCPFAHDVVIAFYSLPVLCCAFVCGRDLAMTGSQQLSPFKHQSHLCVLLRFFASFVVIPLRAKMDPFRG